MKAVLLSLCLFLFPLSSFPADPPPASQVFQVSSQITDPNTVVLSWDIEPGFFLYKDRFQFKLAKDDASEAQLGRARYPEAELKQDKESGSYPIYRNQVHIPLPVLAHQPGELTTLVHYQGCADSGFCYPPIDKRLVLTVDDKLAMVNSRLSAITTSSAPRALAKSESEQASQILSDKSPFLVLLSFFGFGLLLAFTPCVLPMIPVLSGIIVGRGHQISTRKAFSLSLCYVLSMSLTYALAGIIVAGVGANLQAALQAPWAIVSFSLIFVLLALSMFGYYDLHLPTSWQAKIANVSRHQHGGEYLGVAIMGCLSSLILSPCITAPLVGALSYIANTGDMVLGGSALFFLSLGMGFPLLLIGTSAGKLLPKAGVWMNSVKAFFGVLLLGTAIYLLSRIIPAPYSLVLWACLFIVSSLFMGALNTNPKTSYDKLWQGLGLVLLVYGALLVVGASMGNGSLLQPLSSLGGGGNIHRASYGGDHHEAYQIVKSNQDVEQALQQAQASKRIVMLDFYADWCTACQWMEKHTFQDPKVRETLQNMVWLKADVTANDSTDRALEKHYGVVAPPTFIFFDENGREIPSARVVGEKNAEDFLRHLRQLDASQYSELPTP